MGVLLAGLLILALRYRRRREMRRWLDGTPVEIRMSDHGDHLRLACTLHLEPLEGVHLRRWRVALVCAGTEHFPWLDDLAEISDEEQLDERLERPQEIELTCILPLPMDWIERTRALAADAAIATGWCLRVELDFGSSQLWMGVTEPVEELDALHATVN